ncbi:MAG: isoleucine--tRNA ligase, partial [Pseudomonadota bacterium]
LLTGYVKDLFARYQTMQGKRVERRFGWDCHGLPAEMGAEKDLGISGRHAIVKYGIDKFNAYCRSSVMKYTSEWEYYVTRQARFVDFKNDYKTMDKGYMESVIWAFKQLYDKGLAYEAYRVMPYSWAAETPLSNFETRLDNSYRDRVDKAITVAFELKDKSKDAPKAEKYYILAWTTTPWTLPSNLALAVNKDFDYSLKMLDGNCYIYSSQSSLAIGRTRQMIAGKELDTDRFQCTIATEPQIKGSELLGLTYNPLFPYFADNANSFRILDGSDFVTAGDGTGIVHLAPGFGEEDQRVCEANGIELVCPVDHAGRFTDAIYDLEGFSLKGLNVIEENVENFKFGEANERIIERLKQQGRLIKQEQITHNYPHCWRTDKPLIYKAVPSWYIEVTKFRGRMVELNQQINWIPEHIKDGLFGKWLENARDWSISRNRFWGTPIPVWKSASGKIKVFGSIAELEAASGKKIDDLHRPYIDEIVIIENGEEYKRVEDVFDCWFESGSMPYAQLHYPFENKEKFEKNFPADFIVEYTAQTRGWFYTLMILGTALFDKPPFKNCICHGVVLDDKGQKLSKRLNNFADPKDIFENYGADALRWFMVSSPVMRGQELYIDKEGKFIRDVVRLAIKPIWNAYNFFCLYANADGIKAEFSIESTDIMDRYILAKCRQTLRKVSESLDSYDTPLACEAITQFFETLNNWYIRRSKERFWKSEHDADKLSAYNTLYTVLNIMCRAVAPLLPLTLEEIYRGLGNSESVHLADYPNLNALPDYKDLIALMDEVRDICNAAHAIRNRVNIRIRHPLNEIKIIGSAAKDVGVETNAVLLEIIKDEINVKNVSGQGDKNIADFADYKLQINFPVLGKRLPEKIKQIIPAAKKGCWKQVKGGKVEIAGELLQAGEFSILLEAKPEYKNTTQPLSNNDALVILDTTITPELEQEGYARDLVRLIQQARKDAALQVTDRINLHLRVSEHLAATITAFADYIGEQVLAANLVQGDMSN